YASCKQYFKPLSAVWCSSSGCSLGKWTSYRKHVERLNWCDWSGWRNENDGDVLIMVQPINYMLDVQNPVQSAMTGLTQGMQIGQFVQAKELAQKEALQKEQMQQELSAFASKPNKTHEDYATIMARFPALA